MIATSADEIEILREGGKRLGSHLRKISAMVKPGVDVLDLEKAAADLLKQDDDQPAFFGYGSGKNGEKFPGVLCVSINDVIVHSPAVINQSSIQDGDVVCLDLGVKHKGLYTDHAVTVIAGTASKEDAKLVRGTYEALDAGIAEARLGNWTGDIGYAVEKVAEKYDFGFPRNLCGHGVGKKI